MVVYGVLADESVPRLFLAGVIPGLMQAALIGAWVLYYAHKRGYPRTQAVDSKDFWRVNIAALPAFSLPIIVLGGIYGGVTTVTEAAALSAFVAVLISMFIYRSIRLADLVPLMADAARRSASIMIIIVVALVFGHWVTESGMANAIVNWAQEHELQQWHFFLFVTVLLLFLGMFLEVFSVLLIALPVLLPLLGPLGIDPVHFGMVVVINMELALLTPPVGLNLFVLATITKAPLIEVIRGTVPFALLIALMLLLVIALPELSLWLPRMVIG